MENYDRTMELIDTAQDSAGKSAQQFAKYEDTITFKLNQLKTAWEEFRISFMDSDFFGDILETVTKIVNTLNTMSLPDMAVFGTWMLTIGKDMVLQFISGMSDSISGLTSTFSSIFSSVFKKLPAFKIKTQIDDTQLQQQTEKARQRAERNQQQTQKAGRKSAINNIGKKDTYAYLGQGIQDKNIKKLATSYSSLKNAVSGTDEEFYAFSRQLQDAGRNAGYTDEELTQLGQNLQSYRNKVKEAGGSTEEELTNSVEQLQKDATEQLQSWGTTLGSAVSNSLTSAIMIGLSTGDVSTGLQAFGSTLLLQVIPSVLQAATQLVSGAVKTVSLLFKGMSEAAKEAGKATLKSLASTGIGLAIAAIGIAITALGPKLVDLYKQHKENEKMETDAYYAQKKHLEQIQDSQEKLNQTLDETNQKYDEAKNTYDDLQDNYDKFEELNSKPILTEEEVEELTTLQNDIAENTDVLVDHYDSEGNAIINLTDLQEGLNKQKEEYIKLIKEQAAAEAAANAANWGSAQTQYEMKIQQMEDLNEGISWTYQKAIGGGNYKDVTLSKSIEELANMDQWGRTFGDVITFKGGVDAETIQNYLKHASTGIQDYAVQIAKEELGWTFENNDWEGLLDYINSGNYEAENRKGTELVQAMFEGLEALPEEADLLENDADKEYENFINSIDNEIINPLLEENFSDVDANIQELASASMRTYIDSQKEALIDEFNSTTKLEKYSEEYYNGLADFLTESLNADDQIQWINDTYSNLSKNEQEQIIEYYEKKGEWTEEERKKYLKELEDEGIVDLSKYDLEDQEMSENTLKWKKEITSAMTGDNTWILDYYDQLGYDAQEAFHNGFSELDAEDQTKYINDLNTAFAELSNQDFSHVNDDMQEIMEFVLSQDWIGSDAAGLTAIKEQFIEAFSDGTQEGIQEAEQIITEIIDSLGNEITGLSFESADAVTDYFTTWKENFEELSSEVEELNSMLESLASEGTLSTEQITKLIEEDKADMLIVHEDGTATIDRQKYQNELGAKFSSDFTTQLQTLHNMQQKNEHEHTEETQAAYDKMLENVTASYAAYESLWATFDKEQEDRVKNAERELEDAEHDWNNAKKELEDLRTEIYEAQNGTPFYTAQLDDLYNYDELLKAIDADIESIENRLEDVSSISEGEDTLSNLLANTKEKIVVNEAKGMALQDKMGQALEALQKYYPSGFSVDEDTGVLQMEKGIFAAMPDAERDLIQTYIEDYNESLEEYRDLQSENDEIRKEEEERLRGFRDDYIDLQESITEVLKENAEQQVEDTKDKYDQLKEQDDDYLNALEDAINKQKELRDRENKYEDLAQKERTLALKRRDTSGTNRKDVLELEDEVKDSREELLDDEIDSVIDSLKELYETQQEARDAEIEYLEEVTENAQYWQAANEILKTFTTSEDYINWMMANSQEVQEMSTEQLSQYQDQLAEAYATGIQYLNTYNLDMQTILDTSDEEVLEKYQEIYTTLDGYAEQAHEKVMADVQESLEDLNDQLYDAEHNVEDSYDKMQECQQNFNAVMEVSTDNISTFAETFSNELDNITGDAYISYVELMKDLTGVTDVSDLVTKGILTKDQLEKYNTLKANDVYVPDNDDDDSNNNNTNNSGDTSYGPQLLSNSPKTQMLNQENANRIIKKYSDVLMDESVDSKSIQVTIGSQDYYLLSDEEKIATKIVNEIAAQTTLPVAARKLDRSWVYKNPNKYASGGLVDYTGPAWVDGTKSQPEAFLSSEDTRRIGEAAKLLANLPIFDKANYSSNSITSNIGDTSIEVHINVESISNDYDVDDMIQRVRDDIVSVAKPIGQPVMLKQ